MLYQVTGKGIDGKQYSTTINTKSPYEAARLSIGNLVKQITIVMALKDGIPVKSWEMINDKLIRIY